MATKNTKHKPRQRDSRKNGVYIIRSGKEFFTDTVGNHNILHHSENYVRKQSTFKNIIAAGKIFADIMSGKLAVKDENGESWVRQKDGKFKNTTAYIRKKLLPSAKALLKEASKKTGKDFVVKGPRGGNMIDTRKKVNPKLARKQK